MTIQNLKNYKRYLENSRQLHWPYPDWPGLSPRLWPFTGSACGHGLVSMAGSHQSTRCVWNHRPSWRAVSAIASHLLAHPPVDYLSFGLKYQSSVVLSVPGFCFNARRVVSRTVKVDNGLQAINYPKAVSWLHFCRNYGICKHHPISHELLYNRTGDKVGCIELATRPNKVGQFKGHDSVYILDI